MLQIERYELERHTLASLFLAWHMDRRMFSEAMSILKPEYFERPLHQLVFRGVRELCRANLPITPQHLVDWFDLRVEHGKQLLRGKMAYVAEMLTDVPEGASDQVLHWARKLEATALCMKALTNILEDKSPVPQLTALLAAYRRLYREGYHGIDDH